jgi:hypothetical protein
MLNNLSRSSIENTEKMGLKIFAKDRDVCAFNGKF